MAIIYCKLCDRNISPVKFFNWGMFLLLCITGIGGIFYIMWYIVRPKNRCPICRSTKLQGRQQKFV